MLHKVLCLVFTAFIHISHCLPLGHSSANVQADINVFKSGIFNNNHVGSAHPSTESYKYDVFKVKTYGREEAVKEVEGKISQLDTKYSKLQSLFPVEPIVDKVQEHEKYLNDGSQSRAIAYTITGGYDLISKLVNAAIEKPKAASEVLKKNINTILGNFGAQLIG